MHYHYLTIEQREALGREISARIDTLRADVAQGLRQSGHADAIGLAHHIEDVDDEPVADLATALDVAAVERAVEALRHMEAARARLHTRAYGVCVDCEADIPYTRLHANPAATRCVHCQERFEHRLHLGPPPGL